MNKPRNRLRLDQEIIKKSSRNQQYQIRGHLMYYNLWERLLFQTVFKKAGLRKVDGLCATCDLIARICGY